MASANVANTYVVPVETTVAPYYDDFNEAKNFHRILFRPGYPVQARELTQLQTILQNQIERFGRHVFENGSPVIGGVVDIPTHGYDTIKLHNEYPVGETNAKAVAVEDFLGKTIVLRGTQNPATLEWSDDLTTQFRVVAVTAANPNDPPTLYGIYSGAGKFADASVIKIKDEQEFAALQDSAAHSMSSLAFIRDSIFFVNGFFVKVPAQATVIGKYTTTPYCKVGLEYDESIVTETDDTSLLDPAQGSSNYQAPGAARFQFMLNLTSRALTSTDTSKFIELARVENGQLKSLTQFPIYSEIEEVLARRTYDESGNYTVRPFNIRLQEDAYDPINYFAAELSPGKAYIMGYEFETISDSEIRVPKARSTINIGYYDYNLNYGNYVIVDGMKGLFDTSNAATFDIHSVYSADIDHSSNTEYQKTKIGTAKINYINYYGSSGNAEDVSNRQYEFYIFDTEYKPIRANAIASLGVSQSNVIANYYSSNVQAQIIVANVTEEHIGSNVVEERIFSYANNSNLVISNANTVVLYANAQTVFIAANSDLFVANLATQANIDVFFTNSNNDVVVTSIRSKVTSNSLQINAVLPLQANLYYGAAFGIILGQGAGFIANVTNYNAGTQTLTLDNNLPTTNALTTVAMYVRPNSYIKLYQGNGVANIDPELLKNALIFLQGPTANNYLGNVVGYNAATQYLQLDHPMWTGTDFSNGVVAGFDVAGLYLRPTNAVKIFNYTSYMNLDPQLYVGAGLLISGPNANNYLGNVTRYNANSGYVYVDKPFYSGTDYQNCPTALDMTTILPRPTNAIYISSVTAGNIDGLEDGLLDQAGAFVSVPTGGTGSLHYAVANVVSWNSSSRWLYLDAPIYNINNKDFANSAAGPLATVLLTLRPNNKVRIWQAETKMNLDPSLYIGNPFIIAGGNGQGYTANVVSLNTSSWWMTLDKPFPGPATSRPTAISLTAQVIQPLGAVKIYKPEDRLNLTDDLYANAMLYILSGNSAGYAARVIKYDSNSQYFYLAGPITKPVGNGTVAIVPRIPGTDTITIQEPNKLARVDDPGYFQGAVITIDSGAGAGYRGNVILFDASSNTFQLDTPFDDYNTMPQPNSNVNILLQIFDRFKVYGNASYFSPSDYSNAIVNFTGGPSGGYTGRVVEYNASTKYFTVDPPLVVTGDVWLANTSADFLMQIDKTVRLEDATYRFAYDPYMYRGALIQVQDGSGFGYSANIVSYNPANQRFTLDQSYTEPMLSNTRTKVILQVPNAVRLYATAGLFVNGSNVYPNAAITFNSGPANGYSGKILSYNTVTEYFTLNTPLPGIPEDFDNATIRLNNPNNSVLVFDTANTFLFDSTEYDGSVFTIVSGTGAGQTANVVKYDPNLSLITLDKVFTTLPDDTSVIAIQVTGSNNIVRVFNSTNVLSNTPGAYTGATIRIVDGPANGTKYKITRYIPETNLLYVTPNLVDHPTGNISIEFDFAEAKSFYTSKAYTPGGNKISSDANANITIYNKVNNDVSQATYILEPTLSSLLFQLPHDWIAPNLSYSAYTYTKRYDRDFIAGRLGTIIKANTNEDFVLSTSSSDVSETILNNLLVVCTDKKNSSRTNGEIIKVTSSVVNGEMQLYTANASEGFSATVFTTIDLKSPTFPKNKNFVGCNTETFSSETGTPLTGWETGSAAVVYPSAAQVLIINPTNLPAVEETLYLSDVVGIEKIYDLNGSFVTGGADITGFRDVTSYYDFDNGQRDTHYDHATIKLKPNFLPPKGPLLVCAYYFQHEKPNQGVGYFSVDSYFNNLPNGVFSFVNSGVGGHDIGDGYSVIPAYTRADGTTINLRDCLDFRPSRKNASNASPNYEFTDVEAPSPATDMTISFSYYQGRKDLIVLNGDRQFQRIEGLPSADPIEPAVPARTMVLYTVDIPPYTEYTSNVGVKFVDNRRYTMRDIGHIDKRVENLEYYVTLNSLEKQAVETTIPDVNGLDRTKYGIFVDTFNGHSLGAKNRSDYVCSMNVDMGYMSSIVVANNFHVTPNTELSTNIMITRDKILLPFTEATFLTQTDASKSQPVNEFVYGVFSGTVSAVPEAAVGKSHVDPYVINTEESDEMPNNNFYSSLTESHTRTYK